MRQRGENTTTSIANGKSAGEKNDDDKRKFIRVAKKKLRTNETVVTSDKVLQTDFTIQPYYP